MKFETIDKFHAMREGTFIASPRDTEAEATSDIAADKVEYKKTVDARTFETTRWWVAPVVPIRRD